MWNGKAWVPLISCCHPSLLLSQAVQADMSGAGYEHVQSSHFLVCLSALPKYMCTHTCQGLGRSKMANMETLWSAGTVHMWERIVHNVGKNHTQCVKRLFINVFEWQVTKISFCKKKPCVQEWTLREKKEMRRGFTFLLFFSSSAHFCLLSLSFHLQELISLTCHSNTPTNRMNKCHEN